MVEARSDQQRSRPSLASLMLDSPAPRSADVSPDGLGPHSRFFSQQAHGFATDHKEFSIVPGAGYVDLHYRVGLIPWGKFQSFFETHLV
jgi:hypothetical protein